MRLSDNENTPDDGLIIWVRVDIIHHSYSCATHASWTYDMANNYHSPPKDESKLPCSSALPSMAYVIRTTNLGCVRNSWQFPEHTISNYQHLLIKIHISQIASKTQILENQLVGPLKMHLDGPIIQSPTKGWRNGPCNPCGVAFSWIHLS